MPNRRVLTGFLAGAALAAASPAVPEAVAPQDRLALARAQLAAARAALYPAGQSRRDLVAARLALREEPPAKAVPPALAVPAPRAAAVPIPRVRDDFARLLDLVARAEAGAAGYDAVHHRAAIRPPAPPSRLTLGEVLDWIAATPGQPHAIGRYQFIPSTLKDLMKREGLTRDQHFDPALQDRLALRLMRDAGLDAFLGGTLPAPRFMDELAYVWAGLPLENGLSAYHGYAGNRATISRAAYETGFAAIFGTP